jgi:ubiquinone/menaquinone biosynthesis C-methylase UbiE
MMPDVDLYDGHYDQFSSDVLSAIRLETYGEDLGQSSWMTADELRTFLRLLALKPSEYLLEVGSGSGGTSLFIAEHAGSRVHGIDINAVGIKNANELARKRKLEDRVQFQLVDAGKRLPFDDQSFDVIFSNDVICHIPNRLDLLHEWFRILKPGGRMLFTDALVITGMVTHEEMARRSSIGVYVFSPPGVNEHLISEAGFKLMKREDLTQEAAFISKKWHDARATRHEALLKIEGESNYQGLQNFLSCVHTLCAERRLSRFMYLGEKKQ